MTIHLGYFEVTGSPLTIHIGYLEATGSLDCPTSRLLFLFCNRVKHGVGSYTLQSSLEPTFPRRNAIKNASPGRAEVLPEHFDAARGRRWINSDPTSSFSVLFDARDALTQTSTIFEALLTPGCKRSAHLSTIRVDGASMFVGFRAMVNARSGCSGGKGRLPEVAGPDVIEYVEPALTVPTHQVFGGDQDRSFPLKAALAAVEAVDGFRITVEHESNGPRRPVSACHGREARTSRRAGCDVSVGWTTTLKDERSSAVPSRKQPFRRCRCRLQPLPRALA